MSVFPVLILAVMLGSVGFGCVLAWLFARKGLAGTMLKERVDRLEAEVGRLREGTRPGSGLDLEHEVHRLDEKVAFLENLLADDARAGALPPAGREAPGADRQPGGQVASLPRKAGFRPGHRSG